VTIVLEAAFAGEEVDLPPSGLTLKERQPKLPEILTPLTAVKLSCQNKHFTVSVIGDKI
jgi:hypothetical protein